MRGRRLSLPFLLPLLSLLLLPAPPAARAAVIHEESFVASDVLEDVSSPWIRIGAGHTLAMPDGSLLINDNSSSEKIAFETLLGEVEAEHQVTLRAEMMVVTNPDGLGVVFELARPGLEIVLRLHANRVELLERTENWGFRWMGSASADLSDYRVVELEKASRGDDPDETVVVRVDGEELLRCRPLGGGPLDVGRVVVGSLSYPGMGASLWRSVAYRVEEPSESSGVANDALSFGDLKARYGSR